MQSNGKIRKKYEKSISKIKKKQKIRKLLSDENKKNIFSDHK